MDDPWAENAWAEPAKKQEEVVKLPQPSSSPIVVPTWSLPAQTDDEAVAGNSGWGAPSWGTSESGWEKDSTFESTTWQPQEAVPTFQTQNLPSLRTTVTPELDAVSFDAAYSANKPASSSSGASSAKADSPIDLPLRSPVVPVAALPDDTDGFGSFSAGDDLQGETNAWSPRNVFANNLNEDGWGNSWEDPSTGQHSGSEEPVPARDEWEAARVEKARQDRHVPPERLNAILVDFETAAGVIWPETEQGEKDEGSRNTDLESVVPGSVQLMLVPEALSLEMQKPFKQTFTAKHEVEALKLSKNNIVSRKGPLALYLESKGSTSWETAVQSTSDSSSKDAAPAGWKILPKEQVVAQEQLKKPAATGGILSFFSRRTNSVASPTEPQPPSPAKSVKASESPRPSVEKQAGPSPAAIKPSSAPIPSPVVHPASVPAAISQAPSASPSLDFFTDEDKEPKETPPAGVVSRFLGRFSRNKTNDRTSMALSTDDLEFLDDVVPTTNEHDSMDDQLKALSNMIHSKKPSIPTALPAPLAPPPKPTQIQRQPTRPPPAPKPTAQDDLFSLFDSPAPDTALSASDQPSVPLPAAESAFNLLGETSTSMSNAFNSSSSFTSSIGSPSSTIFSSDSNSASLSSRVMSPPIPPPKTNLPPSIMDFVTTLTPSRTPSRASTPAQRAVPTVSMSSFAPPPPSSIVPLAPPPVSNRGFMPPQQSKPAPESAFAEDDFDDFVTSPASRDAAAPPAPAKATGAPKSDSSWDDEFGDFTFFHANSNKATPPNPTPNPPVVPAPSLPASRMAPSPAPSSAVPPQIQVQRKGSVRVSRADHQRTLSLMETVASRGNTWRAPPSPLPEALPPPDPPAGKASNPFGGSIFASQQQQQMPPPPTQNFSFAALQPAPPPVSQPATPIAPPPRSVSSISPPPKPASTISPPSSRGSTPFSGGGGSGMPWKFPPPPGGSRSGTPALSPPTGSKVPTALPPPPGSRSSTPAMSPLPSMGGTSLAMNFGLTSSSTPPPLPKGGLTAPMKPLSATSTGSSSKAGLSATDLAFFEGL